MGLTELEIEVAALKEQLQKITEERDILKEQLVRVGALGDAKKAQLLERIIEEHKDCYNTTEFAIAFDEAASKK